MKEPSATHRWEEEEHLSPTLLSDLRYAREDAKTATLDVAPRLASLEAAIAAGVGPRTSRLSRLRRFWFAAAGGVAFVGAVAAVAISRPTESVQVGPAPAAPPSSSSVATGDAPSSAVVAGELGVADPNASDVPTLDVGALPTVPAGSPAASRRTSASDEELSHTLALRSAVDRAPAEALVLADEGDRRFASGALVEERAVLRIAALARLGRDDEAKARAKDFVARFPKSPLRHRALGHARLTE